MSPLAGQQTELLRALARHGVEFVVVGGVAAQAHGIGYYADWLRGARGHQLADGLTVVVAAPDDILRSKEAAGREKDRAALPQMRQDFIDTGSV